MKSEAVAAESPGGGLSVKAARDVLIKNNGHVGVLTESIVSSSDAKSEDSHEESKERSAGDANDKTGKSEAGGSDMHARSSSSQNTRTSIFDVAASSSSYMDDSVTKIIKSYILRTLRNFLSLIISLKLYLYGK